MNKMVFTSHRSKGDKLVKSFQLNRIESGKYVDITFDNFTSAFEARSFILK